MKYVPNIRIHHECEGRVGTGIIVAIILGVIIGIVILVLIVYLVCFKCQGKIMLSMFQI